MGRVLKSSILKEIKDFSGVRSEEVFSSGNLLPLKSILVSREVQEEVAKLSDENG
jgi:hypothetical protein